MGGGWRRWDEWGRGWKWWEEIEEVGGGRMSSGGGGCGLVEVGGSRRGE